MSLAPTRQTILIIDDNPDNLRVAVEHLAAYSFEVRTARDGDLASSLKEHITTRLEMVAAHLKQAGELLPDEGGDGSRVAECRDHLDTAGELLAPVLRGTVEMQVSLSEPGTTTTPGESALLRLSTREHEVMQLLAEGKANKAIAYTLHVAPSTVSTYRQRILEKLGVDDVPALVRLLLRHEVGS